VKADIPNAAVGHNLPGAAGAAAAVTGLYQGHAVGLIRLAVVMLGDRPAAEDVVQEAFASAVAKRGSFRGSGAASAWIWRIVVNGALSRRRS